MAIYYILNLSICEFSLANVEQGKNMYKPFLGDLSTIDRYIQKIERHKLHANDTFYLTSLYLTYFTNQMQFSGRNNKAIIKELFTTIGKMIAKESANQKNKSTNEKLYFICFIHSHGAPDINNNPINITVDNYPNDNNTNNLLNFISQTELLDHFEIPLQNADCFLINNYCYASNNNQPNIETEISKSYVNFSDLGMKCQSDKKLYILNLSSERVWSDNFDDNSYGIKALYLLFEMGIEISVLKLLDIFNHIATNIPNGKAYTPNITIASLEKMSDNEKPSKIESLLSSIKPTKEYILFNELVVNSEDFKSISNKIDNHKMDKLIKAIQLINSKA